MQGDTVHPNDPKTKIRPDLAAEPANTLAFASTSADEAYAYAGMRASSEGRLFGSVYNVAPKTEGMEPASYSQVIRDPKGLSIEGHEGFADRAGHKIDSRTPAIRKHTSTPTEML